MDMQGTELTIVSQNPSKGEGLEETAAVKTLKEKIFSTNSLVTDCLLSYLSTSDLLSCSLVCKNWNTATREFLQRRRNCLLNIYLTNDGLQEQVERLENGILKFNYPFTGINININPQEDHDTLRDCIVRLDASWQTSFIHRCLESIFKSVSMKNVRICRPQHTYFFWVEVCVKKVVELISAMLPADKMETWRISGSEGVDWSEMLKTVQTNGFLSLKSIQTDYSSGQSDKFYMKPKDYEAILRCCPVLTELNMTVEYGACVVFEKYNKLSLIRKLNVCHRNGWNYLTFNEDNFNAIDKVCNSLVALIVHNRTDRHFTQENLQCLTRILQKNSESLRKSTVHFWESEEIFKLHFPPLSNMEEVAVGYENMTVDADAHCHLQQLFPNARII